MSGAGPGILIVGSGQAARLHAKLLSKGHSSVRLSHWGRSAGRTREIADRYGGARLDGDWSDAISHDDVDAVFVTTPPDTHRDIAVAALDAGKHVIVEKPAFLTPAEFDEIEAAATRAGKRVMVAENYFYKPLLRRIVEVLDSRVLGQVRFITINAVKEQVVDGWRVDPARAGGGALFEGGIHWVSFLASLGLTIRRVSGHFPDAPPRHERSAVFLAEYEEGAVAVLSYSWEIPGTLKGLRLSRIHGTRKSLLFESNGIFLLQGGRKLSFPGLSDIQGYKAMLTDFVAALRDDREPAFTLADARRDVELILAAYDSTTDSESTPDTHMEKRS